MNSAYSRAILAYCLYQLVTRFFVMFCSKFLGVLSNMLFPTMHVCCTVYTVHTPIYNAGIFGVNKNR